jgi:ATP-dependent 26S proteasome regulatory subunit
MAVDSFNGKLCNLSRASEESHEKHSLRQTLLKLKSKVERFKCKSKVPATVTEVFSQAKKIILLQDITFLL